MVLKRFGDWVKANIWHKRFDATSGELGMAFATTDATIVKGHRHGRGRDSRVCAS